MDAPYEIWLDIVVTEKEIYKMAVLWKRPLLKGQRSTFTLSTYMYL